MSDQLLLRTSERSSFKRCRWAWDRGYNDLIKPQTAAPPLRFGSLVHKSLEKFYRPGVKRGPRPATTFLKLYEAELKEQTTFGFRDENGEWQDAGGLGVDMLEHYYETYGKDDEYEVVATEQPFQVPVFNDKGKIVFYYVGVLDGIWRHRPTRKLRLVDHKTAKAISTNHLALDEQAGAYWTYGAEWLLKKGLLKPKQRLDGIMYNFLRKAKRDERPRNPLGQYLNKPSKAVLVEEYGDKVKGLGVDDILIKYPKAVALGEVSKSQPPDYFHRELVWRGDTDRERLRTRVLAEAREMRLIRKGSLEAYKSPGQMTCGGCGYKDICELHEAGADWEGLAGDTMAEWDPYAEHEIYDGR